MSKFINDAKPIDTKYKNYYGYTQPSRYLIMFSSLFQKVVSQAGTYLLTGKFHNQECGIYKCEGGCNIVGVGDLVLSSECCYFDVYKEDDNIRDNEKKMAELITNLVLAFDPESPVESLIEGAAIYLGIKPEEIENVISTKNNPFSGNALSDFFRINPFDTSRKYPEEYELFAKVKYGMKKEDVEEELLYKRKGQEYLKKINEKISSNKNNMQYESAMCCSPRKMSNGWAFWINTGRATNIDYYKTEEEILKFLDGDGLVTKQE